MGHTPSLTRVLTQTTWTGREAAQLVLSAAEDLSGGRDPVFTEAEAARLRRGLPPGEWRDYVWWVEGWQLLQDHLLPTAQIALLEATRGLLAVEVPFVRLLHGALDRRSDVDAVTAWTSLVRSMLADLQPYVTTRRRTLVWLLHGAEAFTTALGLPTLRAPHTLKALVDELTPAVAHTTEVITRLKAIDVDVPELSMPEPLGPDEVAIRAFERRMRPQQSSSWPVLWAWWLARGEEARDGRVSGAGAVTPSP
jgi:hypothetical protein